MHRECREPHPRHHGLAILTCVTHVPWCMSGSLTSGFHGGRWEKRSRNSRHMRKPQFHVSGKKPMDDSDTSNIFACTRNSWLLHSFIYLSWHAHRWRIQYIYHNVWDKHIKHASCTHILIYIYIYIYGSGKLLLLTDTVDCNYLSLLLIPASVTQVCLDICVMCCVLVGSKYDLWSRLQFPSCAY